MYSRNVLTLTVSVLLATEVFAADMKWKSEGLAEELHPIAHLESSFGKNMNHEAHSKGPFYSSYGAVGLKGMAAYEAYLRSSYLKKRFPGLSDKDAFMQLFTTDYHFYNACANVHWYWLRRHTATINQAVFAWRWGIGAATKADSTQIDADKYVASYGGMTLAGKK